MATEGLGRAGALANHVFLIEQERRTFFTGLPNVPSHLERPCNALLDKVLLGIVSDTCKQLSLP